LGDPQQSAGRYLGLRDGRPLLRIDGREFSGKSAIAPNAWRYIAGTFDGASAVLYVDGAEVVRAGLNTAAASPFVQVAPADSSRSRAAHFGGELAAFTIDAGALSTDELVARCKQPPAFELLHFADISVGWPWQTRQLTGLALPQAPATLPHSAAPATKPRPVSEPSVPALNPRATGGWTVNGWRLAEQPRVRADGAEISGPGFDAAAWFVATVPGTVLTTLIDRGVYPDPDYGLNNMAIPESLARQDYWYRTQFEQPTLSPGSRWTLTFNGINYHAQVWLNGSRLGEIRGAFIRGVFDVTDALRAGANTIAVRISPPPHPGIPHEQSIKAGPGENGGALALDGPTFIATEGWDWIPGIRDRNTGLWQDVVLSASGAVRIGDPQVVTLLPLPDTTRADVLISVPLENRTKSSVTGTLVASFDQVRVEQSVTVPPGETTVKLSPQQFSQLTVSKPRLWWPNGYGKQELYDLKLQFKDDRNGTDTKALRFGVRQMTYELSLFDERGHLRRVEVNPALASTRGERLVDVRHEALKKSPQGWAASLYPGALKSPALRVLTDEALTPYLVLKVNGVRIASRGGNWGMDDSRKRSSRERLQPYFRLHREAGLNTIRNWVGLNYEDAFFDLADEYGMLVLSDFWASTQDFQVEPQDPQLFLANARDTIARYRNHPSLALWFGRNEGVPQPILNSGLADLVAALDGTRHFSGSSNRVNLQGSGPYNYRPAEQYFSTLAGGYSVELGVPSLSTLESIRAWMAPEDRWPISDAWAYHDWHHGGNGDTASFMQSLAAQFGTATDLEDFERKAQMMNYVTHRAVFEGFNAHLWTRNSGRLLWMTHPAWPSQSWQIYSSDYDTHAAFYGVKKACSALHVQMNLPDYALAVVNTTLTPMQRMSLDARVYSLDNRLLLQRSESLTAPANAVTTLKALDLNAALQSEQVVLVKLELKDTQGRTLADNFYWQAREDVGYRKLDQLHKQPLRIEATMHREADEMRVIVRLRNDGDQAALANKLTLLGRGGERILPAFYSDNYLSLLPAETREIVIAYPLNLATEVTVALRGWNTLATSTAASAPR
jgi:hypothetical protein